MEGVSHLDRECGCLHGDVGLEEDAGPVVRWLDAASLGAGVTAAEAGLRVLAEAGVQVWPGLLGDGGQGDVTVVSLVNLEMSENNKTLSSRLDESLRRLTLEELNPLLSWLPAPEPLLGRDWGLSLGGRALNLAEKRK